MLSRLKQMLAEVARININAEAKPDPLPLPEGSSVFGVISDHAKQLRILERKKKLISMKAIETFFGIKNKIGDNPTIKQKHALGRAFTECQLVWQEHHTVHGILWLQVLSEFSESEFPMDQALLINERWELIAVPISAETMLIISEALIKPPDSFDTEFGGRFRDRG